MVVQQHTSVSCESPVFICCSGLLAGARGRGVSGPLVEALLRTEIDCRHRVVWYRTAHKGLRDVNCKVPIFAALETLTARDLWFIE